MEYTDEKINEIANDFFKNNRFEKAKIAGFKAGFKKALSLFAVSGNEVAYCKCEGANSCGFEPGENGRLKCAACGGFAI
jgi:hypothetical protein